MTRRILRNIGWLAGVALAAAACASRPEPPADVEIVGAAQWSSDDFGALIAAVGRALADGLEPQDYAVADLEAALAAGNDVAASASATALFAALAGDLAAGAIAPENRARWFIDGPVVDRAEVSSAMATALRANTVGEQLAGFAPPHGQYRALKAALAETAADDAEARAKLRLNMERWRWMPRDLGRNYILVNAPAFELIVVRDGVEIDRRRIIIGENSRPTPQFAAVATGVTFNPVWFVPPSIVAESVGALMQRDPEEAARQGYYIGPDGGVRQKPGPANSLGAMKLTMPNRHSVFLHDTPAKALFKRDMRALSHGCIRIDRALDFARVLLAPAWDAKAIAEIVATGSTVSVEFEQPIPVYVTYFTAAANAAGAVSFYPDIYGLDAPLLASEPAQAQAGLEQAGGGERCPADAG